MATHLTELHDPEVGCDPQFGKRCTRTTEATASLTL